MPDEPFQSFHFDEQFYVGVTAAASAGVYLRRGYVHPDVVMPVMLGVLLGSLIGARLLGGARIQSLRILFAVVVGALALKR